MNNNLKSLLIEAATNGDLDSIKSIFKNNHVDSSIATDTILKAVEYLKISIYEYIMKETSYLKELDIINSERLMSGFIEDYMVTKDLFELGGSFKTQNDSPDFLLMTFKRLNYKIPDFEDLACELIIDNSSFNQTFNFIKKIVDSHIIFDSPQFNIVLKKLKEGNEDELNQVINFCDSLEDNINAKFISKYLANFKLFFDLSSNIPEKSNARKAKI